MMYLRMPCCQVQVYSDQLLSAKKEISTEMEHDVSNERVLNRIAYLHASYQIMSYSSTANWDKQLYPDSSSAVLEIGK